jgi:3-deoxy-D-arabino-heptulosonate 7-phosphate (DAHP) synthase class II
VTKRHHHPGPRPGLIGVGEVRAEGLQGLVDLLQPRIRLGRQTLYPRLGDDPVVLLRQATISAASASDRSTATG